MPLTSYKVVRPWAKAIRDRVVARTMPVWLADPHYGSFRNGPYDNSDRAELIACESY